MAKIGSALTLLLVSFPAFAEVEFSMSADRTEVGTEDAFRVVIVLGNAPAGAVLEFPESKDFEVLSRSQSTQMSYSLGPGGSGGIKNVQRYTLVMRANREGRLTLPPASLKTNSKKYVTEPIHIVAQAGRLAPPPPPRRHAQPSPFGLPPGFFEPDDEGDPFGGLMDPFGEAPAPRSDADLFLRASADKSEVYVGEQISWSLYIYSRLDLSSVDGVSSPKLDGFWSQDLKTPTQLVPEDKVLDGVRYRRYLLRQKALFPMKAGEFTLEATEADITTGVFFAGRRLHKKSNAISVKVKPLPPGSSTLVGSWRLTREISATDVALGSPVQLRFILEGRGNLEAATLPRWAAPAGFKVFDPDVTDKPSTTRGLLGGRRIVEYVLVPQQTGTFTLPGMTVSYFDPTAERSETAQVDELTLTVRPGGGGATIIAGGASAQEAAAGPKNQLVAQGLKSLRHSANFQPPPHVISSQRWFAPLALFPLVLTLALGAWGLAKRALLGDTPEARQRRLAKAARKRLAAAERLLKGGAAAGDFYAEVERALSSFLEAKLAVPVAGLTREALEAQLESAGISQVGRRRILTVLDTCDLGRYAPGMGDASARKRAFDDAAAAMEGWS